MAKYGWATKAMFSFKKKEATYDAAVTINSTNWFGVRGCKIKLEWPDIVMDNADSISGYEFPTQQEIAQNDVKITLTEERCHASFLGAAMALASGVCTSTKDGAFNAWQHYSYPSALNANVSVNGMVMIGTTQYLYKGLVAESVKISAGKEGYLNCEIVLRGSGTRAVDATAFIDPPANEPWLKVRNIRAWLESGTDITIDTTPAQGAENISSATPTPLVTRFRSFEFGWTNNIEKQLDNVGIDTGKRNATCKFSLVYSDGTELANYTAQDNLAFEVNLDSGTVIDAGGAYKWGFILIVSSGRLKVAPIPDGSQTGILTADYEFLVMDDTVNPGFLAFTYNGISQYIA